MSSNLSNTASHLPDVQNSQDLRAIAIQKVGVKDIVHPVQINTEFGVQATVANINAYVNLAPEVKGTHMSRFLEVLNQFNQPLDLINLQTLASQMLARLEAEKLYLEFSMPFFIEKTAPVSQVKSLMNYQLGLNIETKKLDDVYMHNIILTVLVPVKSLCPCSKKISEYGAHNQRSHIIVKAKLEQQALANFSIHHLIRSIESQASCEIWAILKREDEKFITEKAYDNPKFVEDLVRDIAISLNNIQGIAAYELTAENFESIHNHSAYAQICMGQL